MSRVTPPIKTPSTETDNHGRSEMKGFDFPYEFLEEDNKINLLDRWIKCHCYCPHSHCFRGEKKIKGEVYFLEHWCVYHMKKGHELLYPCTRCIPHRNYKYARDLRRHLCIVHKLGKVEAARLTNNVLTGWLKKNRQWKERRTQSQCYVKLSQCCVKSSQSLATNVTVQHACGDEEGAMSSHEQAPSPTPTIADTSNTDTSTDLEMDVDFETLIPELQLRQSMNRSLLSVRQEPATEKRHDGSRKRHHSSGTVTSEAEDSVESAESSFIMLEHSTLEDSDRTMEIDISHLIPQMSAGKSRPTSRCIAQQRETHYVCRQAEETASHSNTPDSNSAALACGDNRETQQENEADMQLVDIVNYTEQPSKVKKRDPKRTIGVITMVDSGTETCDSHSLPQRSCAPTQTLFIQAPLTLSAPTGSSPTQAPPIESPPTEAPPTPTLPTPTPPTPTPPTLPQTLFKACEQWKEMEAQLEKMSHALIAAQRIAQELGQENANLRKENEQLHTECSLLRSKDKGENGKKKCTTFLSHRKLDLLKDVLRDLTKQTE